MKLVRFLKRAFHDGRLVEPGEEMLVHDSVVLSAHMMDVRTETAPAPLPEPPSTVFRADLAMAPSPSEPESPTGG